MLTQVARALCQEAGTDGRNPRCLFCKNGDCQMWVTFEGEARRAIKAVYREYKKTRRWPDFVKEKS